MQGNVHGSEALAYRWNTFGVGLLGVGFLRSATQIIGSSLEVVQR